MSTQDESIIKQRQCPECERLRQELNRVEAEKSQISDKLANALSQLSAVTKDRDKARHFLNLNAG